MARRRDSQPAKEVPVRNGAPAVVNGNGAETPPVLRSMPVARPPYRRLRVYAFDPTLSMQLENAVINHVTVKIPWEYDRKTGNDILEPGPVGEYLEVVDYDPASKCFYAPVDLDNHYILAQDGLEPSEGNPQFHQQMVYAVAMRTIANFEHALGRKIIWASHRAMEVGENGKAEYVEHYVQRLRIYPHALREANAYYSPDKAALLFGYFPATESNVQQHLPGGTVFTCLSHDIVAHETTHAILDSLHRRFNEPSNPDVLALHEAFADIVALFQHFSFSEVLKHQIAKTRGDLRSENLLGQLAQQFGQALGSHGALRDALGGFNEKTGKWEPYIPNPMRIQQTIEPHARGSILVAAVFDAFTAIYKARTDDLLRIATNGTGVLPDGFLHPDLVERLAAEAAKSAQHILNMCIRALDYVPPVDITFGDYLRALITADYDLVPDDDLGYRIAIVEAFRRHGIYPRDVRSLAAGSLRWSPPEEEDFNGIILQDVVHEVRKEIEKWDLRADRAEIFRKMRLVRGELHQLLNRRPEESRRFLKGLVFDGSMKFEVHSVRPVRRVSPDGAVLLDLIIEITQRRPGYFEAKTNYRSGKKEERKGDADFIFRGGATLIVDLETARVRYYIYKDVMNDKRMNRQRAFLMGDEDPSLYALYFGEMLRTNKSEPFAFLHRSKEGWE